MTKILLIVIATLIAGLAAAQVVPQPGQPTPLACAFNTTPATLTSGQAGWVQCNNAGSILVGNVEVGDSFVNITTNADTVVKASAGTVKKLLVGTAGATSSVIIYNNTTCTGAIIGTFSTLAQTSLNINAAAGTGICATTAGGTPALVTITYR